MWPMPTEAAAEAPATSIASGTSARSWSGNDPQTEKAKTRKSAGRVPREGVGRDLPEHRHQRTDDEHDPGVRAGRG